MVQPVSLTESHRKKTLVDICLLRLPGFQYNIYTSALPCFSVLTPVLSKKKFLQNSLLKFPLSGGGTLTKSGLA